MLKRNSTLLIIALAIVALASFRVALRTWPWIISLPNLIDRQDISREVKDARTTAATKVLGKPVPFSLTLKEGFNIGIFAENLGGARVLLFDDNGRLLVSVPGEGKVLRLVDADGDGYAESKETLLENLNKPHGLAFHGQWLYVAETDKVVRYVYHHDTGALENNGEKIINLPGGGRHFSRTIGLGPDGKLYISIGSSCDTCLESNERRAAIMIAEPDGKNARVYASGLRNSVFFRWHPETKELFATDMGRDFLGDNLPPDEVNIIREGKGYGWPFCYGKQVYDTVFRGVNNCSHSEPSFINLPAHVAPLGLAFALKEWGKDLENDLLVAFHGSWNSSVPVGYKVVRFDYEDGKYGVSGEDFITGFIAGDDVLGRPVDLLFDMGRLYISDDKRGVIYTVVKSR